MTATKPAADKFNFTSLACAMPGCGEDLHLEWRMSRPLFVGDLAPGEEPPSPDDAYAATWKVTCADGHVLLVPGGLDCPCEADDCDHEYVDASEETRTFRGYDLDRLRGVLAALDTARTA